MRRGGICDAGPARTGRWRRQDPPPHLCRTSRTESSGCQVL